MLYCKTAIIMLQLLEVLASRLQLDMLALQQLPQASVSCTLTDNLASRLLLCSLLPPQQAKWALDHHSISYKTTPYAINPFYLMQLPLRLRIGRLRGPITAPILLNSSSPGSHCECAG